MAANLQAQPVAYLAIDQVRVCGTTGCEVITVPFNAAEAAVIYGQTGPGTSVRPVYIDTGTAELFSKVYFRVLVRPVPAMERNFVVLDSGFSWNNLREVLISPMKCANVVVESAMPSRVVMTLDHTTCDPLLGVPTVLRFAFDLIDNEPPALLDSMPSSEGEVCAEPPPGTAPMYVEFTRRTGYQEVTSERTVRSLVWLGQGLP